MAAAPTFDPLWSLTLSGAQASVNIPNIDQTYTHLFLVCSLKTATGPYQPIIRMNSDSGSNYSATAVSGNGSGAVSSRHTNQNGIYANPGAGVGSTVGNFMPWHIWIPCYSKTVFNKSLIARFNNPEAITNALAGRWGNTGAITSIDVIAEFNSGNFQIGSSFELFGIKAA